MTSLKRVILETPYRGNITDNIAFALECARDCAYRGEAILASHLLYPQFLDDNNPSERELGIALGLVWRPCADYSVFYTDRGWSPGMLSALNSALNKRLPFKVRSLQKSGYIVIPTGLSRDNHSLFIDSIDYLEGEIPPT